MTDSLTDSLTAAVAVCSGTYQASCPPWADVCCGKYFIAGDCCRWDVHVVALGGAASSHMPNLFRSMASYMPCHARTLCTTFRQAGLLQPCVVVHPPAPTSHHLP